MAPRISILPSILKLYIARGKLRIVSQNLRQSKSDKQEIKEELKNTDIVFAQEINWPKNTTIDFKTRLEKELDCKIYKCEGQGKQHLVTYVRNNINGTIKFNIIIHGRAKHLHIENNEYEYNFINTYGPTNDNYAEFITQYFNKVNKLNNTILLGDYNILLRDDMANRDRSKRYIKNSKHIGHLFNNWIDVHDIIQTDLKYTYTAGQYRARHDRMYMRQNMTQKYDNAKFAPQT